LQKEKRGESAHRKDITENINKEQILQMNTERHFKNEIEGMKMRSNSQEGKSQWNRNTATDATH
jgi:hypothetical protein